MIVLVQGRKLVLETMGAELLSVYDPGVDHEARLTKSLYGPSWEAVFPMGIVLTVTLRVGIGYQFKHGEASSWTVEFPTVKTAVAYAAAMDDLA